VHNAQLNAFKCRRSFIALLMNYQLTRPCVFLPVTFRSSPFLVTGSE
jgi:hypothetical protein